jgi:REP element-mobilizing transposase RayT
LWNGCLFSVFINDKSCGIVIESLNYCHREKGLRINAFVIMPTHMHMIALHESYRAEPLNECINDFRKFTGRRLSDLCIDIYPRCFGDVLRSQPSEDRQRQFWQRSRHPEVIETQGFWQQKMDYIHENPCRKGLVRRAADWRFSSAVYYVSDGAITCDVPITAIQW